MAGKTRKRVTSSDVARQAGVSQAAVSYALRGEPGVSQQVAERIRKLADDMGYYPSAAGQLLQRRRGGRVGQLGVLIAAADGVSALASISIRSCLGQFVDYCSAKQLRYVIEFHQPVQDDAAFVPPHHVAAGTCDGSLILGDVGDRMRQWLDRKVGYPWVSVYEPAEYCVLPQSDVGMIDTVRKLVEWGHRRIACSIGPTRFLTHRLRREGFERAVRDFGLEMRPQWLDVWDTSSCVSEHVYRWTDRILSAAERPTAIICAGAQQAILQRATELGLAVPRDLSLVAWAPVSTSRDVCPHLSVVDLDMAALTEHAMELLLARIDGRRVESRVRWVVPQLFFEGSSTGPAPAAQ